MPNIPPSIEQSPQSILRDKYHCLIGNKLVGSEGRKTFFSFNPATGEKLAEIPDCDIQDVDRAAQAASKAFTEWRKLTPAERAVFCRQFAERLRSRVEVYAVLDALDAGNPLRAMRHNAIRATELIDFYVGLAGEIKGETIPSHRQAFSFTLREPFGVVGRITPFNHPFSFASRIATALIAGNTVVLKPADQTSLSALEMAYDVKEIFPPGVVNIVTGSGSVGAALVAHPLVRRIAFTGSVPVGREILRAAANELKTVSLELGGKNPMIVFPDADIEKAVDSALTGMNYNSVQGQSCGSTSRLFLHERIHDEFLDRLVDKVKAIRVGIPVEELTEMGCLVSEKQYERVMSYVELGKKEGARLVCGGTRPMDPALQQGYFLLPTIFDRVEYQMRLAQEEIFGPVQSVLTWKDERELIRMANSVMYGLTASVWTRDFPTAYRLASEIDAGYLWINGSSRHYPGVPFGGYKQSGLGREDSLMDLLSYTQIKSVNVNLA